MNKYCWKRKKRRDSERITESLYKMTILSESSKSSAIVYYQKEEMLMTG